MKSHFCELIDTKVLQFCESACIIGVEVSKVENIGKRIKESRLRLGLSAEELAPLVGLSPATIYRYENGDIKKVNTNKLQLFADALHTSAAYLMGGVSDPDEIPVETENANAKKDEIAEILYVSKPSGDMKADEVRKFLHELIDELKDEDLLFMKDFSLRMVRKETAYATERKLEGVRFLDNDVPYLD